MATASSTIYSKCVWSWGEGSYKKTKYINNIMSLPEGKYTYGKQQKAKRLTEIWKLGGKPGPHTT